MMAEPSSHPLVSSKPSDSGLHVQLHPLVLLTISDHITRHIARQQQGPIVGALLGQTQGREISVEHAFECPTTVTSDDEQVIPHAWFGERVQQFKDVHKDPALDLVGWFTVTPPSGPEADLLPIHRHILRDYNDSALLLAFHPSQLQNRSSQVGKLPLTIYESVFEGDNVSALDTEKAMQIDGDEQIQQHANLPIRFREVPYSVETGEAEMISVDFVARGGGNAMAIEAPSKPQVSETEKEDGKKRDSTAITSSKEGSETEDVTSALSPEDEDLIANLTTRLNAVKTLESRINLLKSYLSSLPPSFLDPTTTTLDTTDTTNNPPITPSHPILRNISGLLSSLNLLSPEDPSAFATEYLAQENDVTLVSLLGQLGRSVQEMRDLSHKVAVVQNVRHSKNRNGPSAQIHTNSSQTSTLGINSGESKKAGGRGKPLQQGQQQGEVAQPQSLGNNVTATISASNPTDTTAAAAAQSTDEMNVS